jgi:mono/diheme cytochrome c family protein
MISTRQSEKAVGFFMRRIGAGRNFEPQCSHARVAESFLAAFYLLPIFMLLPHSIFVFLLCLVGLAGFASEPITIDFNRYMEGKYVFERNCVVCHGARGDGKGDMGLTIQPRPRSFREGLFKFRSTPFGALPTEADLARTIRGGLSGTGMGMFTHLADDEVRSVIEYLKSFSRRWRKAENYAEPLTLPPTPTWLENKTASTAHAANGKTLFTAYCAACHGPEADGKGAAAIVLKDIWEQPARPADPRQPHLRCGDTPADLYRVLATGLNGTSMVSFETTLSQDQRWDIIAYIQTLTLPDVPHLGSAPASTLELKQKR